MGARLMGKRSEFARNARDLYPTPYEAMIPLTPYLTDVTSFAEPFVGDGDIVRHLERLGHYCAFASDIEPSERAQREYGALTMDFSEVGEGHLCGCSHVISNSPWPEPRKAGSPTLGIIRHLSAIKPTWLLLSADFKHNVYAPEVMAYCRKVVSVGRVRWIPDSTDDGKDNACWMLFDQKNPGPTIFYPRAPRKAIYAPHIEEFL